jgi:putative mRNA 3-end processing factor
MERLITFTSRGLYCPPGDFYIDPWRPVEHAVVTHAHSDHAFPGMNHYYATPLTAAVMRVRLGSDIQVSEYPYWQGFRINGVDVSLHPAGHVPGSAQVRIEKGNQVWVATGDYKLENDGLSTPFESVKGDGMITEATFGLPIYRWRSQKQVGNEIRAWIKANQSANKTSLLYGYSFGKAQRLLHMVGNEGSVYAHGAVYNITEALRALGLDMPPLLPIPDLKSGIQIEPGAIILAPPSAANSAWTKRFGTYEEAFVSGWMSIRSSRRSRNIAQGFTMSDHTDWPGLLNAITQSKATFVQPFCGSKNQLSRYLREELKLHAPDSPAGRYNAPADTGKGEE